MSGPSGTVSDRRAPQNGGPFSVRGLPALPLGARLGVLGGSFDPPHAGHLHISLEAVRRLRLDALWWLVSPGNPLKPDPPAAVERRLEACKALIGGHRRLRALDLESRWGTRYTVDTLTRLVAGLPGRRLVWIMGADGMAELHRWRDWRRIMETVPVAVFGRPGDTVAAGLSRAARAYAGARLPAEAAPLLAAAEPPAWALIHHPLRTESSTAIRAAGGWRR